MANLKVAIIGAGMGGLAAAASLSRAGIDVLIYEQAPQFGRIGAGIQITPNACRVLFRLGLEERLRDTAFQAQRGRSREARTGEINLDYEMGRAIEDRYAAPHLFLHRGDLHDALLSTVPGGTIQFGKKLIGIEQTGDCVELRFLDETAGWVDAVIGADGVHSIVRETLFGCEQLKFNGRVAYRTTFPATLIGQPIDERTKWWGPDRHIVIYFLNPRRDEVYFVTSTPDPTFRVESWSSRGDMDELRAAYADFHPQVRAVLAACPEAYKWALVERDPLPHSVVGRIVLLGDAWHPMTPYMGQGAAMAIEDAVVLSRCMDAVKANPTLVPFALRRYEATRRERTARVQVTSSGNTWMRTDRNPDWVFGYDAWETPLLNADDGDDAAPRRSVGIGCR
jgi:6-hydroxynicotinate 3-monooxygenase